ncbi:MAG: BlaI/MecI/CopY family transcriptional regulator [Verrucomicrobiota bacterium]
MGTKPTQEPSRRERQILDVIYQKGSASVADVREGLADPPSYSAVRTLLTILVGKGFLQAEKQGQRYLYSPLESRVEAGKSAIKRVLDTFFRGSVEDTVTALIDSKDGDLTEEEVERLRQIIEEGRAGS